MRALLAARFAYGAGLLVAPTGLLTLAGGVPPDRRIRATARLLGLRHLLQAAISGTVNDDRARLGAAADAAHATTMGLFACRRGRYRRLAIIDASVAAAWCGDGLDTAGGGRPGRRA